MSIPFDPPRPRPAGGGGGGGAAGFTPVIFTAQWNADRQQGNARAVEPDTILLQEGITSGNGTDNVPYGWSYDGIPANAGSKTRWKVSEEMAGNYTFTLTYRAQRHAQYPYEEHYSASFISKRGSTETRLLFQVNDKGLDEDADVKKMFTATCTTRLIAEDIMLIQWEGYPFTLKGGSVNIQYGYISVVKVSS
jgi:hypothetical protein